jgi:hypothetical protein
MRFNPDKRFLDRIDKINKIELSLSSQKRRGVQAQSNAF